MRRLCSNSHCRRPPPSASPFSQEWVLLLRKIRIKFHFYAWGKKGSGAVDRERSFQATNGQGALRSPSPAAPKNSRATVCPIVMDFRHENMLISVRSPCRSVGRRSVEWSGEAMNVKRKLPPSILHSSFLPSFLLTFLPLLWAKWQKTISFVLPIVRTKNKKEGRTRLSTPPRLALICNEWITCNILQNITCNNVMYEYYILQRHSLLSEKRERERQRERE